MSFISGAMNKSVFNKGSYQAAIAKTNNGKAENGYAVVRIQPSSKRLGETSNSDTAIVGVMDYSQDGLTFSIPSNWRDLGGMGGSLLPNGLKNLEGVFDKVNNIAQIGGAASLGSSFASKLIYQQSGYLEISIPMMVVDWKGIGQPLITAILLANYCLPRNIAGGSMKEVLEKVNTWIDEQLKSMQESENNGEKIMGNLANAAKQGAEGVVKTVENAIDTAIDSTRNQVAKDAYKQYKEIIGQGLDDFTTLRSSPVPVNVEIGQYFKRDDMVIKNLSYTFSKEMTKCGPLYVKFNLELSSRQIMIGAPDCGLFLPNTISRYTVANFTG